MMRGECDIDGAVQQKQARALQVLKRVERDLAILACVADAGYGGLDLHRPVHRLVAVGKV